MPPIQRRAFTNFVCIYLCSLPIGVELCHFFVSSGEKLVGTDKKELRMKDKADNHAIWEIPDRWKSGTFEENGLNQTELS